MHRWAFPVKTFSFAPPKCQHRTQPECWAPTLHHAGAVLCTGENNLTSDKNVIPTHDAILTM
jgi:hypothetical protein